MGIGVCCLKAERVAIALCCGKPLVYQFINIGKKNFPPVLLNGVYGKQVERVFAKGCGNALHHFGGGKIFAPFNHGYIMSRGIGLFCQFGLGQP